MDIKSMMLLVLVAGVGALSSATGAENSYIGTNDGDWFAAENWSEGAVPTAADDVIIADADVRAKGSLTVRNLTLKGKASLRVTALELADKSVFAESAAIEPALYKAASIVRVAETLRLNDSSVIYPESAPVTGVPVFFKAHNLFVAEKASFNAVKCGWSWSDTPFTTAPKGAKARFKEGRTPMTNGWTVAPGAGRSYFQGGVYSNSIPAMPFLPGSPSGNYYADAKSGPDLGRGPGSIVLFVKDNALINGRLIADADFTPNTSGNQDGGRPSGGGILLSLNRFKFGPRAALSAKGGSPVNGNQFGPGGGGRIAVAFGLSSADWDEIAAGRIPADVTVSNGIGYIPASVEGGAIPSGAKRGADGMLATLAKGNPGTFVTVRGNPVEVAVTPAGGTSAYAAGSSLVFNAPAAGKDMADSRYKYRCLGYVVSNRTSQIAKGTGTMAAFNAGSEALTLTWLWGNKEYAPRSSLAKDSTLVALVSSNNAAFTKPLPITGKPEAIGLEFDGDATGANAMVSFTDKKGRRFSTSFKINGEFTLSPLDKALLALEKPDAKLEHPYSLAGVNVAGTTNTLKSVRALYAEPLGRAGRHFASNLSRGRRLGGKVVAEGESDTVELTEDAVARFVLHDCTGVRLECDYDNGKKTANTFKVLDQTEKTLADFLGQPKGTPFTVRDSIIQLEGNRKIFVKPYFRPYRSSSEMVPMGFDYLADNEGLPGAREHVNTFALRRGGDGKFYVWWDGSRVFSLDTPRWMGDAKMTGARLIFAPGSEYAVRKETVDYDTDRYEVLDLSANPRAKAFVRSKFAGQFAPGMRKVNGVPMRIAAPVDSADIAICHQGKGSWALEVDEYTGRKPEDGFGAAVHFRIPAREYIRAHIVFALDPDEKKDKILNLRLAHYILNGSGSNMIGDSKLDFSRGIPDRVKKIGEIVRDGISLPLYAATVRLEYGPVVPEAGRGGYIDFEFLGPKKGNKPDADKESAFNIFGATLEAAPVTFDMAWAPGAPANVFTLDETNKTFRLRFKGERADSMCAVSWTAKDFDGNRIFAGTEKIDSLAKGEWREIPVDVAGVKDPGLYFFDINVGCDGGATDYSYQSRFAILPPSGRLVKNPEKSPYATWWFFGSHGSPNDWDVGGPLLQKAGIRRSCHRNWPTNMMEKYSVTFTGQIGTPSQHRDFDAAAGKFKPHGDLDGEQWFVTNLTEQISKVPYVDHVLVWHESCPRGVIPEEVLGLPVPPADKDDLAAGAYVNECGRLIRKYFPNLMIQIGNSSASLGASYRPFRGGADPKYYDAVGIETPSQAMMPERLLVWGLQGMMITKEAASYYAKRPVPAAACYEYVYRTEKAIGEELQAAWYMRDVLISLANRMPMISPAVTFDVKNGYYDTLWGRAGMLFRAPYCEPKLSYVAYAVLTKVLDGVEYLGQLDTGSTTVYALSFKRLDGKFATAVWTARGEAVLDAEVAGGIDYIEMCGKMKHFASSRTGEGLVASEMPAYIVTDSEVKSVRIAKRGFRQAEKCASSAKKIFAMADADGDGITPDMRIKSKGHGCLPIMEPSEDFSVRKVTDNAKGEVLEVALDTSKRKVNRYLTEYSTIRLKNPPAVPADAAAIGVWVKGNSSWGQVRFELTDADGDVFVNYSHATLWDTLDWQGLLCVNFDGWAYVSCFLPDRGGLKYDAETGLRNSPWSIEVRGRGPSAGKLDLPAKLTAVTVGMNREKLDILDFKKTDTRILLGDVCVEKAASAKSDSASDVRIVIDGAEAD